MNTQRTLVIGAAVLAALTHNLHAHIGYSGRLKGISGGLPAGLGHLWGATHFRSTLSPQHSREQDARTGFHTAAGYPRWTRGKARQADRGGGIGGRVPRWGNSAGSPNTGTGWGRDATEGVVSQTDINSSWGTWRGPAESSSPAWADCTTRHSWQGCCPSNVVRTASRQSD
jgi:hypothetical protein